MRGRESTACDTVNLSEIRYEVTRNGKRLYHIPSRTYARLDGQSWSILEMLFNCAGQSHFVQAPWAAAELGRLSRRGRRP